MKYVWVFFGALLLFSCQDIEKVEKPKNLIPEQKMAEVLTDLSLLNSAKNYNRKFLEETGLKPDEYLYTKYSIDSAQLSQSTRYYAANQPKLEAIYKRVKSNLEKLQRDTEVIKAIEDKKKDSIRLLEKDSLDLDSLLPRSGTMDSLIPSQSRSPELDVF
ncbi:MAG TPA: DUF4296 domain-containing protein [Gillisia sp.]|nr:DUF4296 domain-containing protein [Gillisia sp.]